MTQAMNALRETFPNDHERIVQLCGGADVAESTFSAVRENVGSDTEAAADVLAGCACWHETKEGHAYWRDLYLGAIDRCGAKPWKGRR